MFMKKCAWLVLFLLAASACFSADLNWMLFKGNKIEIAYTKQITSKADGEVTNCIISPNGKYITYSIINKDKSFVYQYIANTDGSQNKLIHKSSPQGSRIMSEYGDSSDDWRYIFSLSIPCFWSPDSNKLIMLLADYTSRKQTKNTSLVILNPNGQQITHFVLDESYDISSGWKSDYFLSKDSRYLAAMINIKDENGRFGLRNGVWLLDLQTEQQKTHAFKEERPTITSFDGSTLLYYLYKNERVEGQNRSHITEFSLDVNTDVESEINKYTREYKPNLKDYGINLDGITYLQIQQNISASADPSPDIIFYKKLNIVKDPSSTRSDEIKSLWMVSSEKHKCSNLLISSNFIDSINLSVSGNMMSLAYINEVGLVVTHLGMGVFSFDERVLAGLQLNEAQLKEYLKKSAFEISIAISKYESENKNISPDDVNSIIESTKHKDNSIILNPNTQKQAFVYLLPSTNINAIENSEKVLVGYFDCGYNWQVNIYANGDIRVVDK